MKGITPLVVATTAFLPTIWGTLYCPPTGQLLPAPDISESLAQKTGLHKTLDALIKDPDAPFNTSGTSFSVLVTSAEDTVFQFHHTAESVSDAGVKKVDGDSVYRIASVTKLFTTLSALMQEERIMDDAVWKHVPELSGHPDFQHITLRMLASHVSGVVRDGLAFDLISTVDPQTLKSVGFPSATPPAEYPLCDAPGRPYCSRQEYLRGITASRKVWSPATTPAYSNNAFILLGLAVESHTGKPLQQIFSELIIGPLEMKSTGLDHPDPSRIVTPKGAEEWATIGLGFWKPTAGLFSTPNDLSRFLRGILNNKIMSAAQTSSWLKPRAYTSSPGGSAVGMPWAVVHTDTIKRPSGDRPLEVYTMLGSFAVYGAYVAVIPEYQIGFVINIAGNGGDVSLRTLLGLAVESFIPEADALARQGAEHKFAGTFHGANGTSIELGLDDGPGLKIKKWTNNGKSVPDAWMSLMEEADGASGVDARIYPIVGDQGRWQVGFQAVGATETALFQNICQTWFSFDKFLYAGLSIDEVVFQFNKRGAVAGLEIPGLRAKMTKA